jgi:hypothetical protein
MKFAPEGNILAIACGSYKIVFYKETESVWGISGEIKTVNVPVAFDFSSDGQYIRTADKEPEDFKANYCLRYWDVAANFGKEILQTELIRSFQWNTYACPCAWDTKGLWNGLVELEPEVEEAADAQLSRSGSGSARPGSGRLQTAGSGSGSGSPVPPAAKETKIPQPKPMRIIKQCIPFCGIDRANALSVVGRRSGTLSLHRVPAYEYDPEPARHRQSFLQVHSGRIAAVLFIEEGSRLVTAGADDGVIHVWRVNADLEEAELDPEELPPKTEEEEEEAAAPADDEDEDAPTEVLMYDSADDEDFIDGKELRAHLTIHKPTNDKLSALRDWITGVGVAVVGTGSRQGEYLLDVTSGDHLPGRADAALLPNEELELEWVYGYSGRISRASVKYNCEVSC